MAAYGVGYDTPDLRRFWLELKAQYIAYPDHNRAAFHVLDSNRGHTPYTRLSALEQVRAATNRLRLSNELASQSGHIVEPALTSLAQMKPSTMTPNYMHIWQKVRANIQMFEYKLGREEVLKVIKVNAVRIFAQITSSEFTVPGIQVKFQVLRMIWHKIWIGIASPTKSNRRPTIL